MDKHMITCFCSDIPTGKLYIKLPVEDKTKNILLDKVQHLPMHALIARIGKQDKKGAYTVNFAKSIKEGTSMRHNRQVQAAAYSTLPDSGGEGKAETVHEERTEGRIHRVQTAAGSFSDLYSSR